MDARVEGVVGTKPTAGLKTQRLPVYSAPRFLSLDVVRDLTKQNIYKKLLNIIVYFNQTKQTASEQRKNIETCCAPRGQSLDTIDRNHNSGTSTGLVGEISFPRENPVARHKFSLLHNQLLRVHCSPR